MLVPFQHLADFDLMLRPCLSIGRHVEHHRLDVVHGMGKPRLRSLSFFKFLKQAFQILSLVFGEQSIQPPGRLGLPFLLVPFSLLIVGIGVAGIDLHDIMDQDHGNGFQNIDFFVGMFRHQNGHQRHMPGMFGIVFLPLSIGQPSLTEDLFLLVCLQCERKLLFQSLVFDAHRCPPRILRVSCHSTEAAVRAPALPRRRTPTRRL